MPMKYKFNIIAALREKGYRSTRIRDEKSLAKAPCRNSERGKWSPQTISHGFADCLNVSRGISLNMYPTRTE